MKTRKILKFIGRGILGIGFGIGVSAIIAEGSKKSCVDNPKEAGKKIGSGVKKAMSGLMGKISSGEEKTTVDCGVSVEDVVTTSTSPQNNGNYPHNNRNNGNWGSNRKFNNNN